MCLTAAFKRKIFKIFGRRYDGYRMFIWVHKLWIPSMILLIFHSQNVWPFLLWPLLFMSLEKFIQNRRKRNDVTIVQARMASKDVLALTMRLSNKKYKFRYKAGQYLFLQCPDISDEWHPFTITSAPEESSFSCHIRCRSDMVIFIVSELV
jgi:predicted ferric reductase